MRAVQDGATVSGFSLRNLLAGAAAALAEGLPAERAVVHAYEQTAAALKSGAVDCRFSGSTAILSVLQV